MLIVLSSADDRAAFLADFIGFRLLSGFIQVLSSLNATVAPIHTHRGPIHSPEWIEALCS
jgi:hypothetical protein